MPPTITGLEKGLPPRSGRDRSCARSGRGTRTLNSDELCAPAPRDQPCDAEPEQHGENGNDRPSFAGSEGPTGPVSSWSICGAPWSQLDANYRRSKGRRKCGGSLRPVASSCLRWRSGQHGKEGVDGSSPSEGSFKKMKPLQIAAFLLPLLTLESTSLQRRAVRSARIACCAGNGLNPGVWRARIGREEDRRMLGTGFGDTLMT